MKITKYYDRNEEQGGGGAGTGTFAALKSDFISDVLEGENKETKSAEALNAEKAAAEKEKQEKELQNQSLELDKSAEDLEKEKAEKEKIEAEKAEQVEKDRIEKELAKEIEGKSPDEIKEIKAKREKDAADKLAAEKILTLDDEKDSKEVEIDEWNKLAEHEGLKIEKNDYQSYIKAHDEKRDADKTKEWEEKIQQASQLSIDKVLEKVKDPKARLLIEMAQIEGMTFDKIAQPLIDVQNAKKMTDEELVRKDRQLKGWKADMIDTEIEELTEREKIKHEADKVRMELDEVEAEIQTSYNNRLTKHKELIESQQLRERQADHESMEKIFSKTDKFMDLEVPKETREKIIANYKAGKYDNLIKDPEFRSKAILHHLFGDKAKSLLKANSFVEGRSTKTKALHNIPMEDSTKKVTEVNQGAKKGAFSAIKEDMDSN